LGPDQGSVADEGVRPTPLKGIFIRTYATLKLNGAPMVAQARINGSSIDVRRFERRDLNRVVEIELASFGRDAWPADAFLEYWRESLELFLIARLGRRIAGYSITRTNWRGAELESIAVDPRYRGRGIAQALLDATVPRLSGPLRLMVSRENEPALRFYQQYGFVRTRLVRRYYGAGRDAWRMRLDRPLADTRGSV
jgi:[ribosomal protein S18]-alanine N-acetyltransferase